MEKEDLIKKLENTDLPNLELQGHKIWLKGALIKWKCEDNKRLFLPNIFSKRILKPAGALVVLLILVLLVSNIVYPTYTLAYVKNLAENNPEIKTILKENDAKIKDIQIIKNRAYILITPKDETGSNAPLSEENKIRATLVQMEIREKKVVEIKNIEPTAPTITQEEKDRAKKLLEKEEGKTETIRQLNSELENTIEIEKMILLPASPDKLELVKRGDVVEVVERKEIKVIYDNQGERKERDVDLTNNKIKEVEPLESK